MWNRFPLATSSSLFIFPQALSLYRRLKLAQKRPSIGLTLAPLLEIEVCSDFGFIEAALKCLHTVNKFCNRIQCLPCRVQQRGGSLCRSHFLRVFLGSLMNPPNRQNCSYREAPCGAHVFEGFFGLENGPMKSDKSQEKTLFGKEMPGRRQPPPQAHFISPNPPRHSRKSVSDGVIQLRVPLAGCAGFFLQAPIPRRILTKMSEAICCMNMRFAKRSWEHPCF